MAKQRLYRLSDSTVVEPLIDRWYAWSFLVSPVTACLHLMNYQIKTMQSYLINPDVHLKASRDPGLIGGPFMEIAVERADEVRRLLEETLEKRSKEIEFARTAIEYQNWFVEHAKGQSLESHYKQMPDLLGGYVELLYDYYNRPTVRFIEGLLYQSEYYNKGLQSFRIAELKQDGSRPFFISTPRLGEAGEVNWKIPFDNPLVDEMFGLDIKPQPLGRIREMLGLGQSDDGRLLSLLSEEQVSLPDKWKEKSIRIRYIGHACVLIEWDGISILTDPYIGVRPSAGGHSRLSYGDLPEKIDYALVTHNHQDHCVLETLLRLRGRIECLVFPKPFRILYGDISLKLMAQKIGFKNVVELDAMESIPLKDGEITAIPFMGEHGDLAHSKTAYVVRAGREQLLFAADSDCLDRRVYENVRKAIGPIETIFLGTESVGAPLSWICGPLFPIKIDHNLEQTRRYHGANAQTGIEIIEAVKAKRIYNYAMGMEPWLDHLLGLCLTESSPQIEESNKLLRQARGRGLIAAERLFGTRELAIDRTNPDYWKQQLEGCSRLALPTDRPQASAETFESERRPFVLSDALFASLADLGLREGHSLATVLLTGFQVLLHRYTDQDDILMEVRIADFEPDQIPPDQNAPHVLPLRTDLSDDPEFSTLLGRAGEALALAYAHLQVPLEIPGAGITRQPLQVLFAFEEAALNQQADFQSASNYDLALRLAGDRSAMRGEIIYNAGLFSAETIAVIVEDFNALLYGIVDNPASRILDIPLFRKESADFAAGSPHTSGAGDAEDHFFF